MPDKQKTPFSQKTASFIVRFRWIFAVIFIGLIVFGGFMLTKTEILYDLSTYVPKGSGTETAVSLLKKEFDDKGSVTILVTGIDKTKAESVQTELNAITGVAAVNMQGHNESASEALFSIVFTDYDATTGANATIDRLSDYLNNLKTAESGTDAYIAGQSFTSYSTRKATEKEILAVGAVIAVLVVLILLFTSKSFFELIIMILVFGAAALINMGTNFILGSISYLSNFIGLILQLVLSIDYSVVMLHRFTEETENGLPPKEAAAAAIKKGIPEILASSLTTVAGLCALMLMTLPIGLELGIVLSKGIIVSLLTVMFFMPALLILFAKPVKKTRHRPFCPRVTKPARKMLGAKKVVVPVFLVIAVAAFTAQFFNSYAFNMNNSKAVETAREHIAVNFGTQNTLVVIVPKGDYENEKAISEYINAKELIDSETSLNSIELSPEYLPGVTLTTAMTAAEFAGLAGMLMPGAPFNLETVNLLFAAYAGSQTPPDKIALIDLLAFVCENGANFGIPAEITAPMAQLTAARANFEGENFSRLMFNINSSVEGEETFALIKELEAELGRFGEFHLAGESVVNYEMSVAFPSDNMKVTLFTAAFILIILLATFRNILLPFLLTLAIEAGVWINFSISLFSGIPVLFIGYLLVTAIQMGATIDYAIILTNRYRTLKKEIPDLREAMAQSINAVFPTILTSGTILTLTGFFLYFMTSEPAIANIGFLLGFGTLLSIIMVLFVLPPLLLVSEKLINKTEFSRLFRKKKRPPALAEGGDATDGTKPLDSK